VAADKFLSRTIFADQEENGDVICPISSEIERDGFWLSVGCVLIKMHAFVKDGSASDPLVKVAAR
jgi:hypothetical protein